MKTLLRSCALLVVILAAAGSFVGQTDRELGEAAIAAVKYF